MPKIDMTIESYDASNDPKDAIDYLQKTNPGLYVMISNVSDTASVFFVSVAPQYEDAIDLKTLSTWLQTTAGLRGGGKKGILQKKMDELLK